MSEFHPSDLSVIPLNRNFNSFTTRPTDTPSNSTPVAHTINKLCNTECILLNSRCFSCIFSHSPIEIQQISLIIYPSPIIIIVFRPFVNTQREENKKKLDNDTTPGQLTNIGSRGASKKNMHRKNVQKKKKKQKKITQLQQKGRTCFFRHFFGYFSHPFFKMIKKKKRTMKSVDEDTTLVETQQQHSSANGMNDTPKR